MSSISLNLYPTHDEAAAAGNPNISCRVSKVTLCFAHLDFISLTHVISLTAGAWRQAPMIPRNSARSDSRTIWRVGGREEEAVAASVIDRQWEENEDARIRRMEEKSQVFLAPSNEKGLQRRGILHGEISDGCRSWSWTRTQRYARKSRKWLQNTGDKYMMQHEICCAFSLCQRKSATITTPRIG